MKHLSWQKMAAALWLCMGFMLVACASPKAADMADEADTGIVFFENGTIYTVDEGDSIVEALAIQGGKIIFTGTKEEGSDLREAAEEVVDLKGGMLLPGFIDAHIHSVTPEFFDFTLLDISDVDEIITAIEQHINAHPERDSYTGFGYAPTMFYGAEADNGPRKERLDAICPEKPVAIFSFDGLVVWMNSKAFELSGINAETVSNPGGTIPIDSATGEVWGTLKDNAVSMIDPSLVELPEEKAFDVLSEFQTGLNARGYTSIMTLPGNGIMNIPWAGYSAMEAEGELTLRVRGAGMITKWQTQQDIAALKGLAEEYDTDLVTATTAMVYTDGGLDNGSALLLEPYENFGGYGDSVWTQDELNEAVASINEAGFQAHIQSVGDGAVRMSLNAAEYAKGRVPEGDYRNVISNAQMVAEEDMPRFGELDVIPVTQPYWHYKEPNYWEPVEHAALGERAERLYPTKSLADGGARLVFSSDYPVTSILDPFVAIEVGVTRNMPLGSLHEMDDITDMDDPDSLLWPEQRLTVQEMIRGFTADAAYSIFAEDVTGTLEVGKSADMIVIDRNLFDTDPLDISLTWVLRTYLQGELVYAVD